MTGSASFAVTTGAGSPLAVAGNPELWGRALWASPAGLAYGGGLGLVLPVSSHGAAATEVAQTIRVLRPWDYVDFINDTFIFRPFIDVRDIDGRVIVQLRQGIDWDPSGTAITSRTTFYSFTCPECDGSGVVATSQGLFALQQPCPRCRGRGSIVEQPCATCHGSGRERRTKRYTVKIPAGVKDGTRIKLKGKGEAGYGGAPAGDLYVITRVEPSKIYERRGDDLIVTAAVPYSTAALGGKVEVPTPEGPVQLTVPAGTEDGKLLRIKGRGAPRLKGSGKGDVLARIKLQVPKKVNKQQRELLEALQKAGS